MKERTQLNITKLGPFGPTSVALKEEEYLFRRKQKQNPSTNIIKHRGGTSCWTPLAMLKMIIKYYKKKEKKKNSINTSHSQKHVNEHTFMYQCH